MGAWDVGPFDNDSAADWCGELHDATPAERPTMIRQALVDADTTEYLEIDTAAAAIAAAAIVAAAHGGDPIESVYAPNFLLEGGAVELPAGAAALAVRALDRIVGAESEWRELWAEGGCLAEAVDTLTPIRRALVA